MLEFIQEIAEARIYKNGETLKGKTVEDLAKITFLTIMMLEILRHGDSRIASKYANDTQPFQTFNSMRTSASDLHNLCVVMSNQEKFKDKISTNSKISLPELQTRRYLKDVANGRKEIALDRSYFKKLEDYLQIKDNSLKNIRRNVADWELNSQSDRNSTINIIKQLANSLSQQNDLYQLFKQVF
jgi:hypothetical protein